MIKALIFDFAGVVGSDGYWLWLNENVRDIERHRTALHEISVRADRAEISVDEFTGFVGQVAGVAPEMVFPGLLSKTVINWELVRLIEDLKPRYKTGLLSNFVFEWLNGILTVNDLLRLFDTAIISTQVKMVKPEPAIYDLACSRLGVTPTEAVFIDDRQCHVNGANSCGLNGLLYQDVTSLATSLAELGVTVDRRKGSVTG